MKKTIVLGVDVGGTHITTALIDIEAGEILAGSEARALLDSTASAREILSTWAGLLQNNLTAHPGTLAIGIAMPGPFDYERGICLIRQQQKFQSLYQLNLKELLAERLSISSSVIHFTNDASSFLEGEMLGGAVKNERRVMGITLGTGLGSAFSLDEQAMDADLWQSPFNGGIAEDFLSTRWFLTFYKQLTGHEVTGVKQLIDHAGDTAVRTAVFAEFSRNLAAFLSQQYEQHQYTNMVIGGNIAKAAPYFERGLRDQLKQLSPNARLAFSILGEKASLMGAARVAHRQCFSAKPVS